MFANFMIGLREGLEAALIIGILIAYLKKTDRMKHVPKIVYGVSAAIFTAVLAGLGLSAIDEGASEQAEITITGITSLLAVGFVTWMVFWMKRAARGLRDELHGKAEIAVKSGALSIATLAFFAVAREGLETSLFVYTNFQTVQDIASPTAGLVLGFAVSITLGFLIYKSAIKLNLSKFFQYSGVALIIVAAGVLSYGVHEFQELGYLPGPDAFVWDVTSFIAKDSILGASLSGTIGFDTTTSWLQLGVWVLYLGAVLVPYLAKPKVTAKA